MNPAEADILIICDGMADRPGLHDDSFPESLRAYPATLIDPVPDWLDVTSENAIASILGADPTTLPGRGALEALGLWVAPAPGVVAARIDFADRTISGAAARAELSRLKIELPAGCRIIEGRGFRHILLRDSVTPLPSLPGMRIWGDAPLPTALPPAGNGMIICAAPVVRGLALALGFQPLTPPGATGDIDTDIRAKARAATEAILSHFAGRIAIHIEAPDEAAHRLDRGLKRRISDSIANELILPVVKVAGKAGLSVAVISDHATDPATGLHVRGPVAALLITPSKD